MQRQGATGIFRRRNCNRKNLGLAPCAKLGGKVGLRLDENPTPAALFKVPCLGTLLRIVGTNFDEITFDIAEERGNQPHLMLGGSTRQGWTFQWEERAFGSRVRSTM